jgi:tetratricopeptide (TPR) repeat protein
MTPTFCKYRSLLLTFLVLLSTSIVLHAQADPLAKLDPKFQALIKSGNDKAHNKDFDGAIADFTEAIKLSRDMPDQVRAGPYINRGMAYADKGDLDAGLADLNQAIKIQSNSFFAYQDRGEIYRKRNEPEKALADFAKAIKLNSSFPSPYRSRGLVLLGQGKDTEAEADFAKYLQMFPNGKDGLHKEIADVKAKRAPRP